jgi:hypothetical protein
MLSTHLPFSLPSDTEVKKEAIIAAVWQTSVYSRPVWMHCCTGLLHRSSCVWPPLHSTVWMSKAHSAHENTFSRHSSNFWVQDNAMLLTWMSSLPHYERLGWNYCECCRGPQSATWRADWSVTLWFSENCSTRTACRCGYSCKTSLGFQYGRAAVLCEADVWQRLNTTDIPGSWIQIWGQNTWPASLPDLTSVDIFLCGHLKGCSTVKILWQDIESCDSA